MNHMRGAGSIGRPVDLSGYVNTLSHPKTNLEYPDLLQNVGNQFMVSGINAVILICSVVNFSGMPMSICQT